MTVAVPSIEEAAGIRRLLDSLDPSVSPVVRVACGASIADVQRLVVLPASFNPPHAAHLALLAAGLMAARADVAGFVLSTRTVDKEQPTGILLEDRAWLVCRLLPNDRYALLVSNRGLYVDMAAALRKAAPDLADLAFVVGYDKIVQIFDPRYYHDRDTALDELFSRARFLVAPRDAFTAQDVVALVSQPENVRYAAGVETMPIDPALARVSSTAARRRAAAGSSTDLTVPEAVRRFVDASGCYARPQEYAERAAAISAAARALGVPTPPP